MKATRHGKVAYKKSRNKTSIYLVLVVLLMVVAVVGWQDINLNKKQKEYDEKESYYLELISEEEARSEELVEFEKYTKTSKYAEEVARQKFGLVKDGEIVFIAE